MAQEWLFRVAFVDADVLTTFARDMQRIFTIAEKLESLIVASLVNATRQAESAVPRMNAVLARSFQLEHATNLIELDRELADNLERVASHRPCVEKVLRKRRDLVSENNTHLLDSVEAKVGAANTRIIWNPTKATGWSNQPINSLTESKTLTGSSEWRAIPGHGRKCDWDALPDTGPQVIQK